MRELYGRLAQVPRSGQPFDGDAIPLAGSSNNEPAIYCTSPTTSASCSPLRVNAERRFTLRVHEVAVDLFQRIDEGRRLSMVATRELVFEALLGEVGDGLLHPGDHRHDLLLPPDVDFLLGHRRRFLNFKGVFFIGFFIPFFRASCLVFIVT